MYSDDYAVSISSKFDPKYMAESEETLCVTTNGIL